MILKKCNKLILYVLFVLFVLNLFLGSFSLNTYKKYLNQRLDPIGLGDSRIQFEKIKDSKKENFRVVFYGSSSAKKWIFPEELKVCEFFNLGVGGQTSEQVVRRAKEEFSCIEADLVILQMGSNDLKAIALFPERYNDVLKSFSQNLELIIDYALTNKMQIVLTTMFPKPQRSIFKKLYFKGEIKEVIKEFNNIIKEKSNREGVFLFDSYSYLVAKDTERIKSEYVEDYMHINENAYKMMNKHLSGLILKIYTNGK